MFLNWSPFMTGFDICIYWRETLSVLFQHKSSYPNIKIYYIRHINFYSTQYYKKTTIISKPKQNIKSRTISFPQSNIQKDYYQFSSNKINHRNRTTNFLPPKVTYIILIDKRIISSTWDMSRSQSIYVWENVYRITQIIDSRIELNSKTTDLYYSQYVSKECEYCSVQYSHFIR